jgi:hypothetical protein
VKSEFGRFRGTRFFRFLLSWLRYPDATNDATTLPTPFHRRATASHVTRVSASTARKVRPARAKRSPGTRAAASTNPGARDFISSRPRKFRCVRRLSYRVSVSRPAGSERAFLGKGRFWMVARRARTAPPEHTPPQKSPPLHYPHPTNPSHTFVQPGRRDGRPRRREHHPDRPQACEGEEQDPAEVPALRTGWGFVAKQRRT